MYQIQLKKISNDILSKFNIKISKLQQADSDI